jgi:hypothetical protein
MMIRCERASASWWHLQGVVVDRLTQPKTQQPHPTQEDATAAANSAAKGQGWRREQRLFSPTPHDEEQQQEQ